MYATSLRNLCPQSCCTVCAESIASHVLLKEFAEIAATLTTAPLLPAAKHQRS
jgi:hypothetical protein